MLDYIEHIQRSITGYSYKQLHKAINKINMKKLPAGHMKRYAHLVNNESGRRVLRMKHEEINEKGANHFKAGYVAVIKHLISTL